MTELFLLNQGEFLQRLHFRLQFLNTCFSLCANIFEDFFDRWLEERNFMEEIEKNHIAIDAILEKITIL